VTDDHPVPKLDSGTPNTARIWDWQLGGKDNFAVDQKAAEALNEACRAVGAPDGREVAKVNRAFIHRAVRYLARTAGIRQFLDLGAGLPTRGNVHEIAQQVNPDARTVYVDIDPMVAVHGRALLADNDKTFMIEADIRDPDALLATPDLRRHLDLDQPVAVLFVAVLHLFPDYDASAGIVARIRNALAPGSFVAITHVTGDARPEAAKAVASLFDSLGVSTPLIPREAGQIRSFFDGFDLVEPGLVYAEDWRPDPDDTDSLQGTEWFYAGVGKLAAERQPNSRTPGTSESGKGVSA
jgi:hypothetical protein